ncbi:hypothetical protein ACNKHV_14095 [Shigella flexneri]
MDITVGLLVNPWASAGKTAGSIPSQEQIDAMKAKTGSQHLTVINQSHQQIREKTCRIICRSHRRPRLCADHSARSWSRKGFPAIWCRWAARHSLV